MVAFTTQIAYDETLDGGASADVYALELTAPASTPELVSRTLAEKAAGDSGQPAVDGTGDRIAFQTKATNLDDPIANPDPVADTFWDIYVHDRSDKSATLASRAAGLGVKDNDDSTDPAIGPDGNLVAFRSDADNLAAADTSHNGSIYLRNTGLNSTALISPHRRDERERSTGPTISFSGGVLRVAFISTASNMDPSAATDDTRSWVATGGTMSLVSREDGLLGAPARTYGPPSISPTAPTSPSPRGRRA